MRKIIMVMVLVMAGAVSYAGCDMCSMYLGLHPNYNKNTLGLRYKYSTYSDMGMHQHGAASSDDGHHHHGATEDPARHLREFQTFEFWGMMYPSPRLQLMVFVPYMQNRIYKEGVLQEEFSGMSDISLLGRYQVYNTRNDTASFRQRIFAGAGVKLPSGLYHEAGKDGMIDPHIQPGTGSTDILLSLGYLCRLGKLGFNTDINYRLNTTNRYDYRYADRLSNTSTFFYSFETEFLVLMPGIGLYTETAGYDMDKGVKMSQTNGDVMNGVLSVDLYKKRFSVNMAYHLPVRVRLNDPQADHQGRIITGINYSF
jgi:hypothetical protein